MDTLNLLNTLLETPSPSGYENSLQRRILDIISPIVDKVDYDIHGNLIAYKYSIKENAKTVMLMAHADEIGLMVQYIEDGGFIRVSKIGGIDVSLLKGRKVVILHNGEKISGVIGARPEHMNKEDMKSSIDVSELWVDIGACSRFESESLVAIGDPVILDSECFSLSNNLVSGRACDDKAGIVSLIKALDIINARNSENQYNIVVVISVQEEVGSRGATTATYKIKPDIGIAIDVAHASDYPTINKAKYGDVRLGNGVAIPIGTDLSICIQRQLMETAKHHNIPYQALALPGHSWTDAHAIQVTRGGCLVGLLSIPCRYMHSPVEVVSTEDVEYTAQLIAEYCLLPQ